MADLREELPYRTEYAKTGRAGCKTCKNPIPKDSVRMAVMVKSYFHDGKDANWHHFDCFFKRFRPKLEEIAHLASLRYEDQKKIEEAVQKAVGLPVEATGNKRKKKGADDTPPSEYMDFKVDSAKSNRSKCRLCENTIAKGTIRISKLDRDSEDARRFGPLDRWFHSECFVSARESLGFYGSADKLPFFDDLDDDDKKVLKKKLPAIKKPEGVENGASPPKKPKITANDEKKLKQQSDLLFDYRKIAEEMNKKDLINLLEYNNIEVPKQNDSKYDRLADAMAFGVPAKCPECKKGQLVFRTNGYICTGNINEWTKCEYQITDNPKREKFKVPKELAENYPKLENYKYKERKRLFNPKLAHSVETASTSSANVTSSAAVPKKEETNGSGLPLSNYNIACIGKLKTSKSGLKSKLKNLGANVVNSIDRTTLCVISTKKEFERQSEQILESKKLSVPIVSEEFIEGVENGSDPIQVMTMNRLDDFDVDIEKRFNNLNVKEKMKTAFKSGSGRSGRFEAKSGTQRMVLKDGTVVDPDCEVAEVTHVLKDGKEPYNAVLAQVDLSRDKNSYYKLQLLEHDTKHNQYFVFRSWGRVGTTIGGTSLEKFKTKQDAIDKFEELYEEKTQNEWQNRHNFKKKPDCYYPVEVDYGGDEHMEKLSVETSKSKLPKPVQELICMIFDVQRMKQQMLEFDLDLERMPLGKLSKKQLLKACSVLKELSNLIDQKSAETIKIKDATNRFYTMIPHNFGTERPPLIDSLDMIKAKTDMLESLMDIEMAYEMIHSTDEETKNMDPIDHHYSKLNAKIEPLDKDSEEFKIIEKYLKNTHGPTHNFSLDIEEVFKVERNGESDKYKKFKDLDRMLLWHGSRVTNYAGILSQGLRIAPPEAPVTGYMFGKGIYFADMVTKSAGYCYHHMNKNTGLLLLSEVAVGKTWDLFDAKDVKKLPKDKHSVRGVGKTIPNPEECQVLDDGVKVPSGRAVDNKDVEKKCSLLYNEYIVYDSSQVNIKYLLKCKFNTKSLF